MMNTYTPEAIKKFIDNAKETQYNVKDIVKSLSLDFGDFDEYQALLENVFDLNHHQEHRLDVFYQRVRIMHKLEEALDEIYNHEDI